MNQSLQDARRAKGLTQVELGIRADLNRSTVAQIECGQRPSRRTAERLAAVLDVDPVTIWPNFNELWRG